MMSAIKEEEESKLYVESSYIEEISKNEADINSRSSYPLLDNSKQFKRDSAIGILPYY